MIDLNELSRVSLVTAEQRQKNGGHVKTDTSSMLKHTATEAVEAMEAYTYYKLADPCCREGDAVGDSRRSFAYELADIICCVLIIAGKEEIDIEQAITDCIEKNRKRAEGTGDKL